MYQSILGGVSVVGERIISACPKSSALMPERLKPTSRKEPHKDLL